MGGGSAQHTQSSGAAWDINGDRAVLCASQPQAQADATGAVAQRGSDTRREAELQPQPLAAGKAAFSLKRDL